VETKEFDNPTSAPLIAPVVTITPVSLLYHVRSTFYIVSYNSPTTHPSPPTYTNNVISKKGRKIRRITGEKREKHKHTIISTKTNNLHH